MIVPAALAGFLVGNIVAVVLDRLYTGAPWGGPLLPCVGCGAPAPRTALLGTVGWLMLRGRCPGCGARLPLWLLYLPLLGAVAFGGAIGFGVMFLLFIALPGFGFGDVRLAGLLGLLAGLTNDFSALTVAALAAGVVSIMLLATRRTRVGSSIPYGPYLVIGALWGMLAGGGPVG